MAVATVSTGTRGGLLIGVILRMVTLERQALSGFVVGFVIPAALLAAIGSARSPRGVRADPCDHNSGVCHGGPDHAMIDAPSLTASRSRSRRET
jgi:hypothetical protein